MLPVVTVELAQGAVVLGPGQYVLLIFFVVGKSVKLSHPEAVAVSVLIALASVIAVGDASVIANEQGIAQPVSRGAEEYHVARVGMEGKRTSGLHAPSVSTILRPGNSGSKPPIHDIGIEGVDQKVLSKIIGRSLKTAYFPYAVSTAFGQSCYKAFFHFLKGSSGGPCIEIAGYKKFGIRGCFHFEHFDNAVQERKTVNKQGIRGCLLVGPIVDASESNGIIISVLGIESDFFTAPFRASVAFQKVLCINIQICTSAELQQIHFEIAMGR